jgi:prophage regulatory protein
MEKVSQSGANARLLLSREDLKTRGISYSRAQLYRKVRDGSFPRPVRLGDNKVAWLSGEIDQWIDRIAAARNLEAA